MVGMYLVDTNVFLEVLLDQKRANECEEIIQKFNRGILTAYVSSFTIHSIEVILEKNNRLEVLKYFLKDLLESKGLKRFDTTTAEEIGVLDIAKRLNLDFDDAINYFICKSLKLGIVSFDKHFDKTDIKRVEPASIK